MKVIALAAALYRGPVAAQEPIGGLGRIFRTELGAFPKRERGYLVADEARTRALRQRLAGDGRIVIGLSWISKAPIGGEQKSATLRRFAALLRMPGCRFVDLQYGDTADERDARGARSRHPRRAAPRHRQHQRSRRARGADARLRCGGDGEQHHRAPRRCARPAHLGDGAAWHARIWYWFRDRDESPWYPRVQVRRQAPCNIGPTWLRRSRTKSRRMWPSPPRSRLIDGIRRAE